MFHLTREDRYQASYISQRQSISTSLKESLPIEHPAPVVLPPLSTYTFPVPEDIKKVREEAKQAYEAFLVKSKVFSELAEKEQFRFFEHVLEPILDKKYEYS